MIIKETVTRQCCEQRDLVCMTDADPGRQFWWFCKHCGRHWQDHGGSEPEAKGFQPLPWPWENFSGF